MFGQFYLQRDEALSSKTPRIGVPINRADYGGDLLAELLNRAKALELGAWWRANELQGAPNPGDHKEALEHFHLAADLFFHDCDEARIRARRARLVSCGSDDNYVVAASDAVEPEESLQAIGGALVPE